MAGIEERKQRGLEIAALAKIEKVDGYWLVPSVTNPRSTVYRVKHGNNATCTCPDHETRGCACKHIYAVRLVVRRLGYPPIDGIVWPDGEPVVEETITITRKTYPQNWPAYNEAQTNEKRDFQRLLADLCRPIPTPVQEGRGKRRLPMSDAVFCAVFKVYCTLSARRFTSDLCDAQNKGYIEKVPHFNSVLNYLDDPQLTPILHSLILLLSNQASRWHAWKATSRLTRQASRLPVSSAGMTLNTTNSRISSSGSRRISCVA